MIMTSNRFPENYEQMGGETEQGTQVTNSQQYLSNKKNIYVKL